MVLSHITGEGILVNPRLMLLIDFEHFNWQSHQMLLANLLTTASLLIAKGWKLEDPPTLVEWIVKVRLMCLVSKLSALCRYRVGAEQFMVKFSCHWGTFSLIPCMVEFNIIIWGKVR